MIGKVVEVFIPGINVMESNKIRFKIEVDGKIIDIIQDLDEFNVKIYKDDLVRINNQIICGKEFIDINRIDEVDYE